MTETLFVIGEQEYNVVKKGLAQATQVSQLGGWLAKYGTQAYRAVQSSSDNAGGIEVLGVILGQLDADALIELFSLLFGCGIEVAREEFDVAVLVDGCFALYENSPAIKRVLNRFFSSSSSTSTPTGQSTQ
jgi:hypothetical protein